MSGLSEAIASALRGEGLSDKPAEHDSDIHSWRCRYPDLYGPCSCFDESVAAIAAAVAAVVEAERAEDRARLAAAWDEGAEATAEWSASYMHGNNGPPDPPGNPYDAAPTADPEPTP